jgi:curli biogenesis system outer membrane secretion channel CsgG
MKHTSSIGLLFAVLLIVLQAPAAAAQEVGRSKPQVAVLEFGNRSGARPSRGGTHAMQDVFVTEIQDVFVTELVKTGKFRVFDKDQIPVTVRSNNLVLSGDVDPATAVRVGKLLGVNYVLTGSVNEYGESTRRTRRGGRRFVAALSARLIDTSTGEIAWADEARSEVSVGGFGGGVDDDRMFDKVMGPCIRQLTNSLKGARLSGKAGVRPRGR